MQSWDWVLRTLWRNTSYLEKGLGHDKVVLEEEISDELDITGIDDEEIDSYLMSPLEFKNKTALWMKVNKEYLKEQIIKAKQGKMDRKEMIKKGLDPDEKKISTKINYGV